VVEGWVIVEVGYFEVSLGNHQLDESFCPSTLPIVGARTILSTHHKVVKEGILGGRAMELL